jgi:hypothetical protein
VQNLTSVLSIKDINNSNEISVLSTIVGAQKRSAGISGWRGTWKWQAGKENATNRSLQIRIIPNEIRTKSMDANGGWEIKEKRCMRPS